MQRQEFSSKIHNFAFPGATVENDLCDQLSSFTRLPALDSDRTTYCTLNPFLLSFLAEFVLQVIFMGINDCGNTDRDELDPIIEKIFDTLHHLYVKTKARSFVLINVPPIDRSPQGINYSTHTEPLNPPCIAINSEIAEVVEERVKTWNDLLHEQAAEFGLTYKDGTLFLFSSHQLLMDVLDDPLEYDFTEDDVTTEVGGIWADDLHLTSEVHDILGEQLLKALAIQFENVDAE